jgi:UDP:flavonoid glycosyltransferase YjiC (YdhE family)
VARIVLNTFGSFGDLHPYLAIAIELRKRGHAALIATSEAYRAKVEAEGVEFAPVRPDVGALLDRPDLLEKLWDPNRGTEYLIRDFLMPQVDRSYQDLTAACQGADLLLTHFAAYAGSTVAEVLNLKWLSVALQPSIFLSANDPPVLPPVWLKHLYCLGRSVTAAIFALGKLRVRRWAQPLLALRHRLGLSTADNPVFEGQCSPFGTLGLFSPHFARPQPDWPPNVTMCGFVFYDRRGVGFSPQSLPGDLARFLDDGSAPVVFTLGSSAVMHPGTFYRESLAAAQRLGLRAVLLVGANERDQLLPELPQSVFVAEYVPYSELLPRAALTVHQGGIGTTAQALRAGKPMLVVPWSHDQPDNAARLQRLGVSRTISRSRYKAGTVAREIECLLKDSIVRPRAAELGAKMAAENGLQNACDAIEAALR